MCDPVTAFVSLGSALVATKMAEGQARRAQQAAQPALDAAAEKPAIPPQPDPTQQRLQAEGDATTAANLQIANAATVRRANVLATGGSADALGMGGGSMASPGKTSVLRNGGMGFNGGVTLDESSLLQQAGLLQPGQRTARIGAD